MENRIKECQLDLYADRSSAATMRANQLRLWFASLAYVLLCALRRIGLAQTSFAAATCGTICLKLLKIGALVRISVRRIEFAMASACPAASPGAMRPDAWRPPPTHAPRRSDTRRRTASCAASPFRPTETRNNLPADAHRAPRVRAASLAIMEIRRNLRHPARRCEKCGLTGQTFGEGG
jgi:hypothetical protein